MLPTLVAGTTVLVNPRQRPLADDLVAAWHPQQPDLPIVKRVGWIDDNGRYYLTSDNPAEGTDSRTFGTLSPEQIIGTVTCRFE